MSKAFTRESDDSPDVPMTLQPPPLPLGAKNYVTERGARVLREELNRLVDIERSRILAIEDSATRTRELHVLDQRVQYVEQSLATAVIVPAPPAPWDVIRFGATVKVREANGESSYRIVGVDETDFDRGWISWCSPVARALLNARKGQRVRFQTPEGPQQLEILDILYE